MIVKDFIDFLKITPQKGILVFHVADLNKIVLRLPIRHCAYNDEHSTFVLYDNSGFSPNRRSVLRVNKILDMLKEVPEDAVVVTGEPSIHDNEDNIVKLVVPGTRISVSVYDQRLINGSDSLQKRMKLLQQHSEEKYNDFINLCKQKNIDI